MVTMVSYIWMSLSLGMSMYPSKTGRACLVAVG